MNIVNYSLVSNDFYTLLYECIFLLIGGLIENRCVFFCYLDKKFLQNSCIKYLRYQCHIFLFYNGWRAG
jgi:hypothetical protein